MVREAITGSGGKASPCNDDNVLARFYHLAELLHAGAGFFDHRTLGLGSANPDDEAWNSKRPSLFGRTNNRSAVAILSAPADLKRFGGFILPPSFQTRASHPDADSEAR
jgi:hypothetical protein